MGLEKALVALSGIMEKSSKANGKMEQKMDMVFGNLPKEITTRATGNSTDSMVREFTSIK